MVLAQNTTSTLTLPLYGLDPTQSLAASVISASPNATTLYLNCLNSPSDPLACIGFAYSRTLITGPSTYLLEVSEPGLTSTQDCVSSTAYAVCDEYMTSGDSVNYQGVATYPVESITSFAIAVTAGLGMLVEAEATGTSGSESASPTGTADMTADAPSSMMTATMTGDAASGTSKGAAAARGVGKELGIAAVLCAMGSLWL